MKQFIRTVLFTILFIVVIFLLGDFAFQSIPHDNVYTFKHEYMENHCEEIETLLIGHSQMEYGFNPHVLGDSTFNLAMCGRVIYYDIELLKRYMPRMKNLKTVILPMHYYFNNFNYFYRTQKFRAPYIFYYYKDMDIEYPKFMRKIWLPYFFSIKDIKTDGTVFPVDSMGWGRINIEYDGFEQEDTTINQVEIDEYISSLEEIAKICDSNNILFIVLVFPCADYFLKTKETTKEGFYNIEYVINRVKEHYPVEYGNYIADSCFRDNKLYIDPTHLNARGATLFAERAKKDFGL